MSTWTETVTYIKSQLRPGVLGNTNVQKILNAVLAIVQQINGGDFSPTPDALWKADVTYAADIQPVLWQDQWLVSNVTDNLGNVPISTTGVVHPSWRVIGSSAGSGIRFWQAIVYPNSLEIVFQAGQLYYLDRGVVGLDPFVSVDFGVELGEEKWVPLLEIPEHNALGGIQGGDSEENEYFHLTAEQLQKVLDLEDTELVDGVTVQGTTEFTTPTSLNVNLWEWNNEGVEQAGGLETLDPILGTPVDYNRVDLLVGGDENDYLYVAGDENIDQEIDPEIPAGYILLSRFLRQPDGTNTATPGGGGGGNFVSKSAGGTQSIKSEFAVKPLAGGQFDYLRTDPNGKLQVVRGDKAGVRTTIQGSVGWARAIRINCNFTQQLNYGMTLELSAVESNDYQTAKLTFYLRFNSSGVLQDSSLLLFGKVTPARYKIVKISTDVYELWLQHFTSLTLYVWRPLFSFGSIDRYTLYNREAITSLPAGDQYDFSEYGGGVGMTLDPDIVDGLEASLSDSPSTSNKYVTQSLLNSYAYVQEAPINGNHYARKDGAWVAFTPFVVAGTPSEGQVVTYVSGVPTWATPSGGGGGLWTEGSGFIYRNGPVVIGNNVWSNNAALTVKGNGASGSWVLKVQDSAGSNLIALLNDRRFWIYSDVINIGNNPNGTKGVTIKSFYNDSSYLFNLQNSSGVNLFTVLANGQFFFNSDRFALGNPSAGGNSTGITVKVPGTGFTPAFAVRDSAEATQLTLYANGCIATSQYRNGFGIVSGIINNGSHFQGNGTSNVAIFVVQNGAAQRALEIRGNRLIILAGVLSQTTDPGAAGALWNDSGTVKISAG